MRTKGLKYSIIIDDANGVVVRQLYHSQAVVIEMRVSDAWDPSPVPGNRYYLPTWLTIA